MTKEEIYYPDDPNQPGVIVLGKRRTASREAFDEAADRAPANGTKPPKVEEML